MKKFLVFTFIVASVLLGEKSSSAYDDLVSYDKATVRDEDDLSARISFVYLTAGDDYDKDGEKQALVNDKSQFRVPVIGRYGIVENLEVFAIVPIVSIDDGTSTEAGVGDIWLGAKYRLPPLSFLSLRAALDLPSGDDKKSLGNAGGFGVDFGALAQKTEGNLMLDGQVGVRWNGEDSDTKLTPGVGLYVDGEATYNFIDPFRAQIGLEYFNIGKGELNGKSAPDTDVSWLELNIGARYLIAQTTAIRGDILYTLTGKNTNASLGFMLSFVSVFDF